MRRIHGIDLGSSDGRERGSMLHTAAAHYYARAGAAQPRGVIVNGAVYTDPSAFYSPGDAIEMWAEKHGARRENLIRVQDVWTAYELHAASRPTQVFAVETEISGILVGDPSRPELLLCGTEHTDKGITAVIPSNYPSPIVPEGGEPVLISRRIDLVRGSERGTTVVDHKFHARANVKGMQIEYRMVGGFMAMRILAEQALPRYTGRVVLNAVGTLPPYSIRDVPLKNTPSADLNFPLSLLEAARLRARFIGTPVDDWPSALNSSACGGRYGGCSYADICAYGMSEEELQTRLEQGRVEVRRI